MPKVPSITKLKSFSLIEAILAISIFSMVVSVLVGALLYGEESTYLAGTRSRANLLAEEAIEAVRNIRDENFASLVNGTYGLSNSGGRFTLSDTQDQVEIFTRKITISTVDPNTKKVDVQIDWQQNQQRNASITLSTYLTNWRAFSGPPPVGDWGTPVIDGSADAPGNENALKVQVQGDYAYVVRDGGSSDFTVVKIEDTASPQIVATLDLPDRPTNIAVSGNYAYISSRNDSQELQIVDISNPLQPFQAGSYNAAGYADANAVIIQGTTVYLSRNISSATEFLIINCDNPNSPQLVGGLNLLITSGQEMVLLGNYVFLGASFIVDPINLVAVVQVIDISNPASPAIRTSYIIWDSWGGTISLAGFGSTLLLGQNAPGNRLYAFDVTNPTSPIQKGSYNAEGIVHDISLGNENKYAFLATTASTKEFQVVDITDLTNMKTVGSLDLSDVANGVAYSSAKDRAVITSSADSQEIIIAAPSP